MDFLLITLAIMSVSILLIYKITRFCGLQLKFQALVLCALLAFVVNFTTLAISTYLTREHFLLIAAMVIISAVAVTKYNERLIQQAAPVLASATGLAAAPEHPNSQSDSAAAQPASQSAVTAAAPASAIVPNPAVAATTPPTGAAAAAPTEPAATPAATSLAVSKPSSNHMLHRAPHRRGQKHRRYPLLPVAPQRTIAEIVQEDMENDQLLKLTAVLAKLGSLDDLLDYAFEQKNQHNYSNAIFAYKQALTRYHSDSYAPFIVIDMGNIYKNSGAYEDAVHVYQNALTLPAVAGSADTYEEFSKNADYLRMVQLVLARHNSPRITFDEIPEDWQQEIETLVQKRHSHKSVS